MKITQPYSDTYCFSILDYLQIDLRVAPHSAPIPLSSLFEPAMRNNTKRWFLFVSTLLGKHLAVKPQVPLLGGILLAYAYKGWPLDSAIQCLEEKGKDEVAFQALWQRKVPFKKKTLIIGFAETATGLAHSLFSMCEGEVSFIHTTREEIVSESPVFTFQEVHSHATGHQCFSEQPDFFAAFEDVILVDDEITTGHTALHLIEALHQQCGAQSYHVVSLLDFRSKAQQKEAEACAEQLGVKIDFISLVQGTMTFKLLKPVPEAMLQWALSPEIKTEEKPIYKEVSLPLDQLSWKTVQGVEGHLKEQAYLKITGRFGLTVVENKAGEEKIRQMGNKLKALRKYENCLVIGTEEFIYIPCLLAACMGEGVSYQSSTRSPIIPEVQEGYPIKQRLIYRRPEDHQIINYLYNIEKDKYDEIFWILERDTEGAFKEQMAAFFKEQGVKAVTFVTCDGERE